MLQTIRDNSQGIIAKIIVGLIVVTFALFGIESIVSLATTQDTSVEVNGEKISEFDIQRAVDAQKRRLQAQFGGQFNENFFSAGFLRDSAIQTLINEKLVSQAAVEQGLSAGPNQLDQMILGTPEFQIDGKFNSEQFQAVLRANGFTPLMFRDLLRDQIIVNQQNTGLLATAFATEAEATRLKTLRDQTRSFDYVTVAAKSFEAGITLEESDIEAYYNDNQDNFMSPEQVAIEYLQIKREDVAKDFTVEESAVKERYDDLKAEAVKNEERRAAHILVEINDDRDLTQAYARAAEIESKLNTGNSFEALAKEYSDDAGSAEAGGDLDFNEKGVFDPAFEDALFALSKGEVSKPIETEYGVHLIKLLDTRAPEYAAFEEMKEELTAELQTELAQDKYIELREQLKEESYSADDLQAPASAMGLVVQSTGFFTVGNGLSVATNPVVRNEAFSESVLEKGYNSDVLELDDSLVVIRKKDHRPEAVKPLEQVKSQISRSLKSDKARDLAKAKTDELKAKLAEGMGLAEAATALSLNVESIDDAKRRDSKVNMQILNGVFSFAAPAEGATTSDVISLANGDQVFASLKTITNPLEVKVEDQDLRALETTMARGDFDNFRKAIESRADIDRYSRRQSEEQE